MLVSIQAQFSNFIAILLHRTVINLPRRKSLKVTDGQLSKTLIFEVSNATGKANPIDYANFEKFFI